MQQTVRVLATLAGLGGLTACHSIETSPLTALPVTATSVAVERPAAAYRIAVEDSLDISVFMVPGLSRVVQVDERGRIDLPLLGSVVAAGQTARELEGDIARQLGAKYIRNPQVTVSVKDGLAQRFAVDGAVARPGIYVAKGDTTLLQAIRTGEAADPAVYGKDAVVVGESAVLNSLKFVRDLSGTALSIVRYAVP
jgi:polysaccharide export outer membrane protein